MRNKLVDLPKNITKLKFLTYVDFQDNYICSPSAEVAAWMKKRDNQWKSKQNCL